MFRLFCIFSLIILFTFSFQAKGFTNNSNPILLSSSQAIEKYPYIQESSFQESLVKIWDSAGHGQFEFEGAFSVHRASEGWQFRNYPVSRELEKFKIPFNLSFRALIHTHRDLSNQLPSGADREVAMKWNIPVFVLSKQGLSVFDPRENKTFLFKNRGM